MTVAVLPAAALSAGAALSALPARATTPAPASHTRSRVPRSPGRLLGQRIMVGFPGTTPTRSLLNRVRTGQVGAVILFSYNISSGSQVRDLTRTLQRAARAGRNPPLLIAVDQEGGQVKRFPDGPPFLSPPEIAHQGCRPAHRQGRLTGAYLKDRGVNMDLAPVVDVPTYSGAFIWQQGRAFSFRANTVTKCATGFALALQSAGVAATGKHFPGVGSAGVDTDNQLDELHPTRKQRRQALLPYRALIARGLDAVMLSTAGFPAYDPSGTPTALSRRMIGGLLRKRLGFDGVTITDALESPTGHDKLTAGVLAARAGADILLYTEAATGELDRLKSAFRTGHIRRADAVASYERIVALKRRVGLSR
ncbi:MAG: glycoside hydrolase family 3 N-terminal domain-containing protein [Solirubrobacteraceae bacterium]